MRKLDAGGYDAIVLAAAGLKRLGLADRIRALFDPAAMIPCAGQGALGIEVRASRQDLIDLLAPLASRQDQLATAAERAVSRAMGGSCSVPLAAHARWQGAELRIDAAWGEAEGHAPLVRALVQGQAATTAQAEALGQQAAQALRQGGARVGS